MWLFFISNKIPVVKLLLRTEHAGANADQRQGDAVQLRTELVTELMNAVIKKKLLNCWNINFHLTSLVLKAFAFIPNPMIYFATSSVAVKW